MAKNIFYTYNPETDNFERFYPSWKTRLKNIIKILLASSVIAVLAVILYFSFFETPNEAKLREENDELHSQLNILDRRLSNSLKVMDNIRDRDDNFYRVMMQLDPLSATRRYAGLDQEKQYKNLKKISDASLIQRLSRQMDLLERSIYAQSLSFDQLKNSAEKQKEKLSKTPSVLPINIKDYTLSSGYGLRRDPVLGSSKFHAGLDISARDGTPVYATAEGCVVVAERKGGYGNCIDIDHGFNYLTRFAHLNKILVKPGQKVKRGELIGLVGSTGKSTGPHLHYEVRFKDEPQNPVNYFFMDITAKEYEEMIRRAEDAANVMD
ncbi:MAG: M23 family metallopeptidase [Muribaculaceae bacterium]|nr:M23 family metallopeptidase [Muribaculaceae bacterium]